MKRIIDYLKNVEGELRHVSWPNKREVAIFTVLVIIASLITAGFLGFFDFVFSRFIELVMTLT